MRHETQCVCLFVAHSSSPLLTTTPGANNTVAGRVTLCSPDHVSLLLHRTLNMSTPQHHIPQDHWEFEYAQRKTTPNFAIMITWTLMRRKTCKRPTTMHRPLHISVDAGTKSSAIVLGERPMAPLYGSWVSSFLYSKRKVVRTESNLALAQADSCESDALLSWFHTA